MPPFKYYLLKSTATILRSLIRLIFTIKATPTKTLQIPSRDPNRTIKLHVYEPLASSTPSPESPGPVLLNFCGSGFVIDGHGLDDAYCHLIAAKTAHTVLDVQYRYAPEHPCPAALEDAEDIVAWARNQKQSDPARLSIGGFSAGGSIAISIAGSSHPGIFRALLAFYPVVDASIDPGLKSAPDPSGRPLPTWLLRFYQRCYLLGGMGATDPRVSPVFVKDKGVFPGRCLFVTAAWDSLAVEVEAFAGGLESQGRVVVCERVKGCGHAWDKVAREGSLQAGERDRAYALAVEMLN